jgi:hypothetical protein
MVTSMRRQDTSSPANAYRCRGFGEHRERERVGEEVDLPEVNGTVARELLGGVADGTAPALGELADGDATLVDEPSEDIARRDHRLVALGARGPKPGLAGFDAWGRRRV